MDDDSPEALMETITQLRLDLRAKDSVIEQLEARLQAYETVGTIAVSSGLNLPVFQREQVLESRDVARFSRQMILPEVGVTSQLRLKGSSVLVVGCGGLGCPAAVYLCGAGVGRIGLVDYDTVEISNLHRQILHTQSRIGELKCVSVAKSLAALNPYSEYLPIQSALSSQNALEIIEQFDVVLDCSDNVATRYLLNDACVISGKPLVSGSALRWEGQLTVYNLNGGPTYRCLYPTPPPPSAVTNCSDGGVIGAVPGVIGVLQALETIKILTQGKSSLSGKLLLFDGLESRFRTVKLRSRSTEADKVVSLIDYVEFCGSGPTDKEEGIDLLRSDQRISVQELRGLQEEAAADLVLLDVRTHLEFEMCHLPGSRNLPLDQFSSAPHLHALAEEASGREVVLICRRGNDSQRACAALTVHLEQLGVGGPRVRDVVGGLHAWARHVDPSFPVY